MKVSFKQRLRRTVEAKITRDFAKFVFFKGIITILSYNSLELLTMRHEGLVFVTWGNSLITQIVEFFVLGHYVFNGREKSPELVRKQLGRFWAVVICLGWLEGQLMGYFLVGATPFFKAYVAAHIPTMTLRFLLDRYWVYRESLTPSSQ
jgi:hypothetical protein